MPVVFLVLLPLWFVRPCWNPLLGLWVEGLEMRMRGGRSLGCYEYVFAPGISSFGVWFWEQDSQNIINARSANRRRSFFLIG